MKKMLLFLCLGPVMAFAQTNRVTVSNGNFYDPLIWNPVGFPVSGDSLTINHAVTLNVDAYYNAGQIKVNSGGSLIQDAAPRNMWIDGGSLVNHGTFETHLLYISNGGYITNTGLLQGIDSMMVEATLTNSGTAQINDFWVMIGGLVNNSGTLTNTDSMLVQGDFVNTGIAGIYDLAFDQMASLNNSGPLEVTHNMHNQGHVLNTYYITVANDFSNCNTQSAYGVIENNGVMCFGNDFLNCDQDTITGSGDYFVGNLSTNLGVFAGTHIFHTPNGSLTLNGGTIGSGVSFATGACSAGISEVEAEWTVYPNPADEWVSLGNGEVSYRILNITGQLEMEGVSGDGTVRVDELAPGVHLVQVNEGEFVRLIKR